jgi:predicted transcriptional regulator
MALWPIATRSIGAGNRPRPNPRVFCLCVAAAGLTPRILSRHRIGRHRIGRHRIERHPLPAKKKRARGPRLDELLGPLEAEVMEILWKMGASLVSEVEEVLNRRRSEPLAYKTVLTICTRLTDKGLLDYEKEGRAFRYHPTMNRPEFIELQALKGANDLLNRFGDLAISTFVEKVSAHPEQLKSLRELLNPDT